MTGLFWVLVFAGFWQIFPDFWSRLLHWAGGLILALHALELIWLRRRLEEQVAEVRYHQFLMLLFGVFHWLPLFSSLRKKQEAAR